MRRRRIVEVTHRVVIGTKAAVDQVLDACGWKINTAMVERLNLSLRQRAVAIRRRSASACKSSDSLRNQLILFQVYYNFVLPHASIRQALAEAIATNGRGSAKVWRQQTPAMAAGLTDHLWTLKEVLMFRVPPWPQPQAVYEMAPLDDHGRKWPGALRCRSAGRDEGLKTSFECA